MSQYPLQTVFTFAAYFVCVCIFSSLLYYFYLIVVEMRSVVVLIVLVSILLWLNLWFYLGNFLVVSARICVGRVGLTELDILGVLSYTCPGGYDCVSLLEMILFCAFLIFKLKI